MFLLVQAYIMCLIPCFGEALRDGAGGNMAKYGIGQGIIWMRSIMYLSSMCVFVAWYFNSMFFIALGCFFLSGAGYRLLEYANYVRSFISYQKDDTTS